jgi:hypothetical protein
MVGKARKRVAAKTNARRSIGWAAAPGANGSDIVADCRADIGCPQAIHSGLGVLLAEGALEEVLSPAGGQRSEVLQSGDPLEARQIALRGRQQEPPVRRLVEVVQGMNGTIKDATVKRFHYESHDQLR